MKSLFQKILSQPTNLFCLLILISATASAQLNCLDFNKKNFTSLKNEITAADFEIEYEYSNLFTHDQRNSFDLHFSPDSVYCIAIIPGKNTKGVRLIVSDSSKEIILDAEQKDQIFIKDFRPIKEEELTLSVLIEARKEDCTYVAVGAKAK